MRQLNVIEIDSNDNDLEYNECRKIFDINDIIYGGYCAEDEIGWQTGPRCGGPRRG